MLGIFMRAQKIGNYCRRRLILNALLELLLRLFAFIWYSDTQILEYTSSLSLGDYKLPFLFKVRDRGFGFELPVCLHRDTIWKYVYFVSPARPYEFDKHNNSVQNCSIRVSEKGWVCLSSAW